MPAARLGPAAWLLGDAYRLGVAAVTLALGAFFALRLHAFPPHEDETLAFFVSRQPLGDLLETVLGERGGAPLHYLVVHLFLAIDESLTTLRLGSVVPAVASVPVIAALVARLSDRRTAVVAAVVAAASWGMLFHGIYARMYGLFLLTSALSLLLLLRALERPTRGRWAAWGAATLALLASQPYGALVLAAEVTYVALLRLRRPFPLRTPIVALVAVVVLAAPLWRTYLVLASRFEVGLGEATASQLGSPLDVLEYLWEVLGDFTAGWIWTSLPIGALAVVGIVALARTRPEAAVLSGVMVGVPALALVAARSGAGASLETRHLIFLLPLLAMAVAAGLLHLADAAGRWKGAVLAGGLAALVVAQVGWGIERTPWLYRGEPDERTVAREQAAGFLAASSRPDDVLFGYEPTYFDAWMEGAPYGETFVPRADAKLAIATLRDAGEPLGRGTWVLDVSDDIGTDRPRMIVPAASPGDGFEARAFGPFLIVRTLQPVVTIEEYLEASLRVQQLSFVLGVGDATRNAATVEEALDRIAES